MAFRFETANERWSWFKEADQPWAMQQKQQEFDLEQLDSDLMNQLYGDVAERFGFSSRMPESPEADSLEGLIQAAEKVLHGEQQPDERTGPVAEFIKQWVESKGWTPEGYDLGSRPHDEFPYRRTMPGQITAATDNKDLASTVQDILNKTFCLYMTASKYHWNVKGTDFPQYHEFFGEIYEDAQGAIDHLAEMILMLGSTADLSPDKVGKSVTPSDMIRDLLKKSETLIEDLTKAVDEATDAEEHAVANDLAERLGAHQKWAWQLRSTK